MSYIWVFSNLPCTPSCQAPSHKTNEVICSVVELGTSPRGVIIQQRRPPRSLSNMKNECSKFCHRKRRLLSPSPYLPHESQAARLLRRHMAIFSAQESDPFQLSLCLCWVCGVGACAGLGIAGQRPSAIHRRHIHTALINTFFRQQDGRSRRFSIRGGAGGVRGAASPLNKALSSTRRHVPAWCAQAEPGLDPSSGSGRRNWVLRLG